MNEGQSSRDQTIPVAPRQLGEERRPLHQPSRPIQMTPMLEPGKLEHALNVLNYYNRLWELCRDANTSAGPVFGPGNHTIGDPKLFIGPNTDPGGLVHPIMLSAIQQGGRPHIALMTISIQEFVSIAKAMMKQLADELRSLGVNIDARYEPPVSAAPDGAAGVAGADFRKLMPEPVTPSVDPPPEYGEPPAWPPQETPDTPAPSPDTEIYVRQVPRSYDDKLPVQATYSTQVPLSPLPDPKPPVNLTPPPAPSWRGPAARPATPTQPHPYQGARPI